MSPSFLESRLAEDGIAMHGGEKIRMDAGVALYQAFELATAPEAGPTTAGSSRAGAGR